MPETLGFEVATYEGGRVDPSVFGREVVEGPEDPGGPIEEAHERVDSSFDTICFRLWRPPLYLLPMEFPMASNFNYAWTDLDVIMQRFLL